MKKIIKIVAFCLVLINICFIFAGCNGCSEEKLSYQGNGNDYSFNSIETFSSLSNYTYNEKIDSFWDYYSVDYELNTFGFEYKVFTSPDLNRPQFGVLITRNVLLDVFNEAIKGHMAHSNGIYYIKEIYPESNESCELLYDSVFNKIAVKISKNDFFSSLFQESHWITYENEIYRNVDISMLIKTCNHFYDYEFLEYYNYGQDNYIYENNIYKLNENNSIKSNFFSRWFWALDDNNKKLTFSNQVTANSATINLQNPTSPIVSFSLTTYYESIEKSITCNGSLKYNYVDNTKINIPEEVLKKWQEDSTYTRNFN